MGVVSSYYDMRNEPCVLSGLYRELMLCSLPKHVCHGLDKRQGNNSAEYFILINFNTIFRDLVVSSAMWYDVDADSLRRPLMNTLICIASKTIQYCL